MRVAILLHGTHVGVATLQQWCRRASRRTADGVAAAVSPRAASPSVPRDLAAGRARLGHGCQRTVAGHRWHLSLCRARPRSGQSVSPGGAARPARDRPGGLRSLARLVRAPCGATRAQGRQRLTLCHAAWRRGRAGGDDLLHSPPACPRYNGSIEASIGAISTRAHHAAAAHGHPDYWTTTDVEIARSGANLARGLTTAAAAALEHRAVDHARGAAPLLRAVSTELPTTERGRQATRAHRRTAIVRTLDDSGILLSNGGLN